MITGSMTFFHQENDVENTFLSLNALYVIYKSDPLNYQHLISVLENLVVEELTNVSKLNQGKTLDFIHTMISMLLKDRNIDFAKRLLQHCDSISENIEDNPTIRFKNFRLWAQYYRLRNHTDQEIYYLERSLEIVNKEDSIDKAIVLTELGFAKNQGGAYFEAINIFSTDYITHTMK